ncbi:MAG: 16S rRNA (uracil(1498)-N(3))-methyltransferase [Deltaproteobacteria bacterium]|nr:16S rRNA (uracil(1498)-N(3))-methyltransferase [Deltaproteobacteria bacterium]
MAGDGFGEKSMTRILLGTSLMDATLGQVIHVTGDELHYLKNVRRHVAGDEVVVFDHEGSGFEARVTAIDSAKAVLELTRQVSDMTEPTDVHILTAVPKEKILDDVVRKLSELGVARMTPLLCERSSVVPGEQRVERWRRIAEQSMRQCRRRRVLQIDDAIMFSEAMGAVTAECRFVLHPSGEMAGGTLLGERMNGGIALLIGPEGGFSDGELAQSTEHMFKSIRLGGTILRMETAILVAAVAGIAMLGGYDR